MPSKSLITQSKLTPLQRRRKIALIDAGITGADVARAAGVNRAMVSMLIADRARSRRIEELFAKMTGLPVEELFPTAA